MNLLLWRPKRRPGRFGIYTSYRKDCISSTASFLRVLEHKSRCPATFPDKAVNYTLSAGYLVLPVRYTNFNQTNLNVYAELLGQAVGMKKYNIDLAPAVQLIFNSNSKLNLGYRLQLKAT